MGRIYDYSAYSASKKGGSRGDYSFGSELKYSEIDLFNRPEEYADLDDAKAFIEYSIDLIVKKSGNTKRIKPFGFKTLLHSVINSRT